MKLENFTYEITARAEGDVTTIWATDSVGINHFFLVQSISGYWIVVSPEISDMFEADDVAGAEALRSRLLSLYMTHRAAILAATRGRTDAVEVAIL